MKEITIISGKGGTGKTTITASLASMGQKLILCDADVDAPDLHLLMLPDIQEEHVFESSWLAEIDTGLCTQCGICQEYCRFDAIHPDETGNLKINPFKCEGCRLCEKICPSGAIHSSRNNNNHWYISQTQIGTMVHASMGAGEENSGKLVTQVRKTARELAKKADAEWILTDGPPGTGCPVIASVTGTDAVLLVIEPSTPGIHDAKRIIELVRSFNIPVFAMINKADINPDMTKSVCEYLEIEEIPLLGQIPFDPVFVKAMIRGSALIKYAPESVPAKILFDIWMNLERQFVKYSVK